MEGYIKTRLYKAFWEVLPSIYKMIKEYKRFSTYYITLALSNQYTKKKNEDIETNFILISINNILEKLYKY